MTQPKYKRAVPPGGDSIYHHAETAPWAAPQGEGCIEQIADHIRQHLGQVETVFHEMVSDTVHIDVHCVSATEDFPYVRLVTSGMSDLAMHIPKEVDVPRFTELMVTLPADWKLDQESLKDENWYWPIRMLKTLARMPHKYQTWLGWGHTVPNGDPAEPYAPDTLLNGAIILPSITVPDQFHKLRIDDHKQIAFLAVVPLYQEEMELKLRAGTDTLLEQLSKKFVSDVIDPARTNAVKKRFGMF